MRTQTLEISREIERQHLVEEQKANRDIDWLAVFPDAHECVNELIEQKKEIYMSWVSNTKFFVKRSNPKKQMN